MSYIIYGNTESTEILSPDELFMKLKHENIFEICFDLEANGHDYIYSIYFDIFRGVYISEYSVDGEDEEVFEYTISELSDLIANYTNEFYNKIIL